MSETEDLLIEIDKLRDNMQLIINKKNCNLIDPEVITASETLNAALNTYSRH